MATILLIDDNSTFLEALHYALKSKSINVITATCVKDALDILKKIKFDLIISDYEMGSDNGLSILKFLRNNNDNVKFIMLTGNDSSNLQYEVEKEKGIFLDKGNLNLLKIIKNILENKIEIE